MNAAELGTVYNIATVAVQLGAEIPGLVHAIAGILHPGVDLAKLQAQELMAAQDDLLRAAYARRQAGLPPLPLPPIPSAMVPLGSVS